MLPLAFIIFSIIGVMFLGIGTPSEAAATGSVSTIILLLIYRRLNWQALKKAIIGTVSVTGMLFLIIVGAMAFSQILAASKATVGLSRLATSLPVPPIVVVIAMQLVLLLMGCFMDPVSMMMITLPIFVPVIVSLGFSPVWFAIVFLLNVEVAAISPPFGLSLFAMKAVATSDVTMGDIYKSSAVFIGLDLVVMGLVMTFPKIALWLPGLMA